MFSYGHFILQISINDATYPKRPFRKYVQYSTPNVVWVLKKAIIANGETQGINFFGYILRDDIFD
jgi:hypothetical protein